MAKSKAIINGIENIAELLGGNYAERIARAKDIGFDTENFVYLGRAGDYPAYDLAHGGKTSGSAVGPLGVSVALSPATANEFANLAVSKGSGEAANIIQGYARPGRQGSIELDGTELDHEIASTVASAWDAGYDSIKFDNYTTPSGEKGGSFILLKDPSQLRSRNADFNPDNANSSNLLASAAPYVMGGGALAATVSADHVEAMAATQDYDNRRAAKSDYWKARRQDVLDMVHGLNDFTNNTIFPALDKPVQGYMGRAPRSCPD